MQSKTKNKQKPKENKMKILNEFKALGFNVTTNPSSYTLELNERALKRLGRCEVENGNHYIIMHKQQNKSISCYIQYIIVTCIQHKR